MKMLLCGLNGAGKTTVGRALAKALHFRFLDVEELFFSKKDPLHPYADMRSSQGARALFSSLVTENKDLVFSCLKGDFLNENLSYFDFAVYLSVPKEVRMQRVYARSY